MGFDRSSYEKQDTAAARLRHMADAAVAEVGFAQAEDLLVSRVESDNQLVEYAVRSTARSEVRMAMAVRRQRIAGAEETVDDQRPSLKQYSRDVCARVSEYAGKFLGWPMSTRKVLGEATVEDVAAEAQMYEASAQGNARNGRFMRQVERRLRTLKAAGEDTVGKLLTDSQLARMMAKAQKAE